MSARRGSRCRRRTRADAARDRLQRGVPPDGLESIDSSTVRVKLISPLRPAVLAGRDPGLHLPDHADPPRGLSRRSLIVGHVSLRELPLVRGSRSRARPGSGRRDRRERRREDEPARGGARRHPGVLAADAQRRAADPVRRDGRGRLASRRRGRRRPRGAGEAARGGRQVGRARRLAPRLGRAAPASVPDARLHTRPPCRRQGRPVGPARLPRPRARPALAGARAASRRSTPPRSPSATRRSGASSSDWPRGRPSLPGPSASPRPARGSSRLGVAPSPRSSRPYGAQLAELGLAGGGARLPR